MLDIRKYIPGEIVFKSIYWLDIENQMIEDQKAIFQCLDADKLQAAEWLIGLYDKKYKKLIHSKMPIWLVETHAKVHRAIAMLECMKPQL
jgi:hypothetical protein